MSRTFVRSSAVTALAALFGCMLAAGCRISPANFPGAQDLAEVEALERARFEAWTRADTQAMRPVLGDDLLYCHSTGQCETKEEIVGAIGSRETIYRSIDVLELKPRAVGGAVLINGKVAITAERGGQVARFQAIYTDVYVKRDGRWQMVSWQSTSLP